MKSSATSPGPRGEQGFLLVGVLVGLALVALGSTLVAQRLSDQRQREKELELLFIGEQFRAAILSYWKETPGGAHSWPVRMEDLLEDRRFPSARRHLRRIYTDPISGSSTWGLVHQGAALVGVYSEAAGVPFRQVGFAPAQKGFEGATRYADWRFVAEPPISSASAATATSPSTKPAPTTPPVRPAPPGAKARP
jgi:type II secretory pathway pseudopilin PulG